MGAELAAILNPGAPAVDADAARMLRFQAGESACFDELVERYRRPLMGFLTRMVRNPAAAEDLVQEAFVRVYQHRGNYRADARFSTWIYRIASRLALNHLRDHRRDRSHASLDDHLDPEGPATIVLADHRPSIEQHLLDDCREREQRRRVRMAIARLPERQRAAVILHKYQELGYDEIGRVLELSPSATKSLLFRAYERLRQELKDCL